MRQWEVEDRDRLLLLVTAADRNDLVLDREVDLRDRDGHVEQLGVEREREVLVEHREQGRDLFWTELRLSLKRRGLAGTQLVISDQREGVEGRDRSRVLLPVAALHSALLSGHGDALPS